jgi:hypothetical protein
MEVNIYIGFGTLEVKCTQYGICGTIAFKNAKAMVFLNSDGWAIIFGQVQIFLNYLDRQLPLPESISHKYFLGER